MERAFCPWNLDNTQVNEIMSETKGTYHQAIGFLFKASLPHQAVIRIGQILIPDAEIPQLPKGSKLANKPIIYQQLAWAEEVCVAGHFRGVRFSRGVVAVCCTRSSDKEQVTEQVLEK